MKRNVREGVVNIPNNKKIWYSITKFERYPEMATEGVGRAFLYLAWLIFLFAICITIAFVIKYYTVAKKGLNIIENDFTEINYEDGVLLVQNSQKEYIADSGRLVINTDELTSEEKSKYEETSNSDNFEIIWLKDEVILKNDSNSWKIEYKDVMNYFGLKHFNKSELINFLTEKINSPKLYIIYGIVALIYLFLAYFLSALLDILVLSFFGWITTLIAQIRIRYRAIFNMSVYAITISTILQLIYIIINTFTSFYMKYFNVMYTTISFICLAASIFMIKSDFIKQQLELIKVIEIKKQIEDEKEKNEEEPEEENSEDEEKKEEPKEEKKEQNGDVEGSNA